MKRFIALFVLLAFTSFTCQASTAEVAKLFNEFKYDVTVQNLDQNLAVNKLVQDMVSKKMSINDLRSYVRENAEIKDYAAFEKILADAGDDISSLAKINAQELQFIVAKALNQTTDTGANYAACSGTVTAGVMLIVTAVALGLLALSKVGVFTSHTVTNYQTETNCEEHGGIWVSIGGSHQCQESSSSTTTTTTNSWEPSQADRDTATMLGVAAGMALFISIPILAADCE